MMKAAHRSVTFAFLLTLANILGLSVQSLGTVTRNPNGTYTARVSVNCAGGGSASKSATGNTPLVRIPPPAVAGCNPATSARKLTVTVIPYASTAERPRVATKYHLTIRASTDGKLPSNLMISNTLGSIAGPVEVGQPFPIRGQVTNSDDVSHTVYFKTYGVNAAVLGTPTPIAIGPGDSVPFVLEITALQDGWISISLLTWSEESAESETTPGTVFVQAGGTN